MRVLLGRPHDPQYRHRTSCSDCGADVYLGDRQQAIRREPDVAVRCQDCVEALGELRVFYRNGS